MSNHTLAHALRPAESGCTHNMAEIHHCVICSRQLKADRVRVDTCGQRCSDKLNALQNAQR